MLEIIFVRPQILYSLTMFTKHTKDDFNYWAFVRTIHELPLQEGYLPLQDNMPL